MWTFIEVNTAKTNVNKLVLTFETKEYTEFLGQQVVSGSSRGYQMIERSKDMDDKAWADTFKSMKDNVGVEAPHLQGKEWDADSFTFVKPGV